MDVKRYLLQDDSHVVKGFVAAADYDALAAERQQLWLRWEATSNRALDLETQMRGQTFLTPDEKDARIAALEALLRSRPAPDCSQSDLIYWYLKIDAALTPPSGGKEHG